ncbi:MAG: putative transcriptional regulator [Solidesulfovibrio magneticus str. Maddingley MBC34]|uniref:Putative transcriptional regulator n=1 Tax=Solidesulfovibrio magneticus str. Maddingley MBC34 TaxID=1206767 RepID=K6FIG0_9BACT|nr:MAG: putative transcriptional regulator [Solidesulfovibrio magneticus str. Maddingley MBC34]
MQDHLTMALEIVKAQAKVRDMKEDEIRAMVARLSATIRDMDLAAAAGADMSPDAKRAIKERTITCLESGKPFKILTRKHLAKYGLTPDEYRAKWGYAKDMPLVCKALQRERRKKMRELRLWERRGQGDSAA